MSSLCQNLKASYEELQRLTVEFTVKYNAVKETGDLGEVKRLRKNLELARSVIFEYLTLFNVPNAKNPYHKALRDAGLDQDKTSEQQEMRVDIRKEIQRQLAVYREVKDASGRPLLEEWLEDITKGENLIYEAVVKDYEKIIERIKEGMIPVVMPGREVQERTWEAVLTYLKPTWIENGTKQALNEENYLYGGYKTDRTKKMTRDGFFKNIPDRPYLVWVKPTQEPDPETMNQSFDEQQVLYAKMIADDKRGLYDSTDLTPIEYVALQAMATSQIRELFKELQGGTKKSTTIKPLDTCTGTYATTRFLSAGLFSDGFVACAYFSPDSRRVRVGRGLSGALGVCGFRPAARS